MVAPNAARFKINGTASADANGNRIYRAHGGDVLTFTLEDNPSPAVSVTYDIWDPANTASPAASYTAINRETIFGVGVRLGNGLFSQTLSGVNGNVTMTMPTAFRYQPGGDISFPLAGPASWIVRCTATLASGRSDIFERGVAVMAYPDGYREPVFGERDQFFARGWGDSPLGAQISNSFPQLSVYDEGTLNSVAHSTVTIFPSNSLVRHLIIMAEVYAVKNAGAVQALWGLRRVCKFDGGGGTLSVNAGGQTLDGTVNPAEFEPTIVLAGGNPTIRLDQKVGGMTFDWKCWLTVMESKV